MAFFKNLKGKLADTIKDLRLDEDEKAVQELVARATTELLPGPDWGANMEFVDFINRAPRWVVVARARRSSPRRAVALTPPSSRPPPFQPLLRQSNVRDEAEPLQVQPQNSAADAHGGCGGWVGVISG